MKLINGNMWDEVGKSDLILFTANSTVNNGRLVMGGGAAKEALKQFPGSDAVFGHKIDKSGLNNGIFGLLFPDNDICRVNGTLLGAFQTKTEVWKPSTLGLVKYSTNLLHAVAHNWDRIILNMPGTGLGGLDVADVIPIVETLPDNVVVYVYQNEKIVQNLQLADQITQKIIGKPLYDASE